MHEPESGNKELHIPDFGRTGEQFAQRNEKDVLGKPNRIAGHRIRIHFFRSRSHAREKRFAKGREIARVSGKTVLEKGFDLSERVHRLFHSECGNRNDGCRALVYFAHGQKPLFHSYENFAVSIADDRQCRNGIGGKRFRNHEIDFVFRYGFQNLPLAAFFDEFRSDVTEKLPSLSFDRFETEGRLAREKRVERSGFGNVSGFYGDFIANPRIGGDAERFQERICGKFAPSFGESSGLRDAENFLSVHEFGFSSGSEISPRGQILAFGSFADFEKFRHDELVNPSWRRVIRRSGDSRIRRDGTSDGFAKAFGRTP